MSMATREKTLEEYTDDELACFLDSGQRPAPLHFIDGKLYQRHNHVNQHGERVTWFEHAKFPEIHSVSFRWMIRHILIKIWRIIHRKLTGIKENA